MTITSVGNLISNTNTNNVTSFSLSILQALAVGDIAVIQVTADNVGTTDVTNPTSGESNEILSLSLPSGNLFTKVGEVRNAAAGAAGDGVTVALFYCKISTAVASGVNLTITLSSTLSKPKVVVGWKFTKTQSGFGIASGTTPIGKISGGVNQGSADINPLVNKEYLWFRASGCETGSRTINPTSGFTQLNTVSTGSGSLSNLTGSGEFRIFTGTSNPSDPSWSAIVDSASIYVAFEEDNSISGTGSSNGTSGAVAVPGGVQHLGQGYAQTASNSTGLSVTISGTTSYGNVTWGVVLAVGVTAYSATVAGESNSVTGVSDSGTSLGIWRKVYERSSASGSSGVTNAFFVKTLKEGETLGTITVNFASSTSKTYSTAAHFFSATTGIYPSLNDFNAQTFSDLLQHEVNVNGGLPYSTSADPNRWMVAYARASGSANFTFSGAGVTTVSAGHGLASKAGGGTDAISFLENSSGTGLHQVVSFTIEDSSVVTAAKGTSDGTSTVMAVPSGLILTATPYGLFSSPVNSSSRTILGSYSSGNSKATVILMVTITNFSTLYADGLAANGGFTGGSFNGDTSYVTSVTDAGGSWTKLSEFSYIYLPNGSSSGSTVAVFRRDIAPGNSIGTITVNFSNSISKSVVTAGSAFAIHPNANTYIGLINGISYGVPNTSVSSTSPIFPNGTNKVLVHCGQFETTGTWVLTDFSNSQFTNVYTGNNADMTLACMPIGGGSPIIDPTSSSQVNRVSIYVALHEAMDGIVPTRGIASIPIRTSLQSGVGSLGVPAGFHIGAGAWKVSRNTSGSNISISMSEGVSTPYTPQWTYLILVKDNRITTTGNTPINGGGSLVEIVTPTSGLSSGPANPWQRVFEYVYSQAGSPGDGLAVTIFRSALRTPVTVISTTTSSNPSAPNLVAHSIGIVSDTNEIPLHTFRDFQIYNGEASGDQSFSFTYPDGSTRYVVEIGGSELTSNSITIDGDILSKTDVGTSLSVVTGVKKVSGASASAVIGQNGGIVSDSRLFLAFTIEKTTPIQTGVGSTSVTTSSADGKGISTWTSQGSGAATSIANGVDGSVAGITPCTGTSTGTSDVLGQALTTGSVVVNSTADGNLKATGTMTGTVTGSSTAISQGLGSGGGAALTTVVSTANGVGISTWSEPGTIAGSSTAFATGESNIEATGFSSGTSTTFGALSNLSSANGASSSISTSVGVPHGFQISGSGLALTTSTSGTSVIISADPLFTVSRPIPLYVYQFVNIISFPGSVAGNNNYLKGITDSTGASWQKLYEKTAGEDTSAVTVAVFRRLISSEETFSQITVSTENGPKTFITRGAYFTASSGFIVNHTYSDYTTYEGTSPVVQTLTANYGASGDHILLLRAASTLNQTWTSNTFNFIAPNQSLFGFRRSVGTSLAVDVGSSTSTQKLYLAMTVEEVEATVSSVGTSSASAIVSGDSHRIGVGNIVATSTADAAGSYAGSKAVSSSVSIANGHFLITGSIVANAIVNAIPIVDGIGSSDGVSTASGVGAPISATTGLSVATSIGSAAGAKVLGTTGSAIVTAIGIAPPFNIVSRGEAGSGIVVDSTGNAFVVTVTPSVDWVYGDIIFVMAGADNVSTIDSPDLDELVLTDASGGNIWTKLGEYVNGSPGAFGGAVVAIWVCRIVNPISSGSSNITISNRFASGVFAWATTAWKFYVPTNYRLDLNTVGGVKTTESGGGNPYGTLSIAGLAPEEHLFIRATALENNGSTSSTTSPNYTGISGAAAIGNTSSNSILLMGEFRAATITNSSSVLTGSKGGDSASVFVALDLVYTLGIQSGTGIGAVFGDSSAPIGQRTFASGSISGIQTRTATSIATSSTSAGGASVWSEPGTINATAVANGVGRTVTSRAGITSVISSASGAGISTWSAPGSVTATSSISAVGQSNRAGVAFTLVNSMSTGVGGSTWTATGTVVGNSLASGSVLTTGFSSGNATVNGFITKVLTGAASSTAIATVSGIGAKIFTGKGSAIGTSVQAGLPAGLQNLGSFGSTANISNANTIDVVTTKEAFAGSILYAAIAKDNMLDTAGREFDTSDFIDASGNVWKYVRDYTNSAAGSPGDGVSLGLYKAFIVNNLPAGSTITFSFLSAVTAKVATMFGIWPGLGYDITEGPMRTSLSSLSNLTAVTLSPSTGYNDDWIFFRVVGHERGNVTLTVSPTSAVVFNANTASTNSGTLGMSVWSIYQFEPATSGSETIGGTFSSSSDCISFSWVGERKELIQTTMASAAGNSMVSAIGNAVNTTIAVSSAESISLGIGRVITPIVAISIGISESLGIGQSTRAGVGESSVTSNAVANTAVPAFASGFSFANAVGVTFAVVVGSSTGNSIASAIGQRVRPLTGISNGLAIVEGAGSSFFGSVAQTVSLSEASAYMSADAYVAMVTDSIEETVAIAEGRVFVPMKMTTSANGIVSGIGASTGTMIGTKTAASSAFAELKAIFTGSAYSAGISESQAVATAIRTGVGAAAVNLVALAVAEGIAYKIFKILGTASASSIFHLTGIITSKGTASTESYAIANIGQMLQTRAFNTNGPSIAIAVGAAIHERAVTTTAQALVVGVPDLYAYTVGTAVGLSAVNGKPAWVGTVVASSISKGSGTTIKTGKAVTVVSSTVASSIIPIIEGVGSSSGLVVAGGKLVVISKAVGSGFSTTSVSGDGTKVISANGISTDSSSASATGRAITSARAASVAIDVVTAFIVGIGTGMAVSNTTTTTQVNAAGQAISTTKAFTTTLVSVLGQLRASAAMRGSSIGFAGAAAEGKPLDYMIFSTIGRIVNSPVVNGRGAYLYDPALDKTKNSPLPKTTRIDVNRSNQTVLSSRIDNDKHVRTSISSGSGKRIDIKGSKK